MNQAKRILITFFMTTLVPIAAMARLVPVCKVTLSTISKDSNGDQIIQHRVLPTFDIKIYEETKYTVELNEPKSPLKKVDLVCSLSIRPEWGDGYEYGCKVNQSERSGFVQQGYFYGQNNVGASVFLGPEAMVNFQCSPFNSR